VEGSGHFSLGNVRALFFVQMGNKRVDWKGDDDERDEPAIKRKARKGSPAGFEGVPDRLEGILLNPLEKGTLSQETKSPPKIGVFSLGTGQTQQAKMPIKGGEDEENNNTEEQKEKRNL